MGTPVRRVVTGVDSRGKAVITSDGPTPVVSTVPHRPGLTSSEVWVTTSTPALTKEPRDPTERTRTLQPPPNGSICRVAEFPPDETFIHTIDRAKAVAAYTHQGALDAVSGNENAPHPFMHKTKSVDYGIVLSGEIYLVLDDSETLLKPGDIVVQRATNHAWSNRSEGMCRVAFILLDGTFDA